jgi:hypothetical protein
VVGKPKTKDTANPIKQKTNAALTDLVVSISDIKKGLGKCARVEMFLTNTATFVKHKPHSPKQAIGNRP